VVMRALRGVDCRSGGAWFLHRFLVSSNPSDHPFFLT